MTKYRSIFISDTHIGMKIAKVNKIVDFLKTNECEYLYLVGDIFDIWALKKNWYWNQSYNDFIQIIMELISKNIPVRYILGNHDEDIKPFIGLFGEILVKDCVHIGVDGKKYFITHGDEFDPLMRQARWLISLGNSAYDLMIFLNTLLNHIRKFMRRDYWSLSSWAKRSFKRANNFINDFELVISTQAKHNNCVGIICGHIHYPIIKQINDVTYMNCGDFVESNSFLIEDYDGNFKIIEI